jgi:predicted RNA methylase
MNDSKSIEKFKHLLVKGELTAKVVESQFSILNQPLDEWMEGDTNWEEVVFHLEDSLKEEFSFEEIPKDTLTVLSRSVIENTTLKLPFQLERALYEKVNRVLVAMGGKWSKKLGGHVFHVDPTELLDSLLLTGKVSKPERFGYVPTPKPLAESVVARAEIMEGMTVLEPEAGSANLADIVARFTCKENIVCYELQEGNVQILKSKGYRVVQGDFLTFEPEVIYDRVVMNPPFERQQDILHVQHAWKFLKPGGILVSIMSTGFTFRVNKLSTDFRDFVAGNGYLIENPVGSFKASGTSVNTVTVILYKPCYLEMREAA